VIKSMTGFGRGESVSEDCKVTVEIKAVNHRLRSEYEASKKA